MKPIPKTNFISPGKVYCLCPPKYCLCCQNLTFIQPHSLECAVGGRALYAFPAMVHGVRVVANVQLRVQWAVHYRTGVRSVWLLSSSTIELAGQYPSVRDDGIEFAHSEFPEDKLRARWASAGRRMRVQAGVVQKRVVASQLGAS